ncbi:MAG: hypothetical protein M1833_001042 [Piccolia ochrophora]|nr:MAG: hypothetical protein M1833_001042 [Piccolia ochrophora]
MSNPSSTDPSRTSTPNPATAGRFTAQLHTAEDLLKSQTVGLVHLSDFRKRRAEALEQKEREAQDRSLGRFTPAGGSGTATPSGDGASTPQPAKKRKKKVATGKLSFGIDDEEGQGDEDGTPNDSASVATQTPRLQTPEERTSNGSSPAPDDGIKKKRLGANAAVGVVPKTITKSALLREAQARESLRKEFLTLQDRIKETDILIPFVFYDGSNIPGGVCKVKKGDYVWLFLDKARKVGAELGVGGGERANSRREWARVGVDDLMLVRGEVIIPHHYEFYYFIINKTKGHSDKPLFDYSVDPPPLPDPSDAEAFKPLSNAARRNELVLTPADERLEGLHDDPNVTKVVDRRWYERNKHIFPASVWEEFDPEKNYGTAIRRDAGGNAFFFS